MPGRVPDAVEANGFRVLDEAGPDVLLDFLDCPGDDRADLVARVRMRADMLGRLLVQLNTLVPQMGDPDKEDAMLNSPDFQRGQFQSYRATTRIHLGPIQKDIDVDDTLEYDGYQCRYNGETFSMPQMKSSLAKQWFVPESDQSTQYVAQPAGVLMRPAQNAMSDRSDAFMVGAVADDEVVVGSVDATRLVREAANKGVVRQTADEIEARRQARIAQAEGLPAPAPVRARAPVPVADVADDEDPELAAATRAYQAALAASAARKQATAQAQRPIQAQPQQVRGMPVVRDQEQVAQHRVFQNPAVQVVAKVDKSKPVPFRAKVIPGPEDEDQGARPVSRVLAPTATTLKMTSVADADRAIARLDDTQGRTPARVAKVASAGARVMRADEQVHEALPVRPKTRTTLVTEGEALTARVGAATGDVSDAVSSDDLLDLVPGAAVAGLPAGKPFSWDKTRHWRVRVNDAFHNYRDKPEMLQQILDVEAPGVIEKLNARLAGQPAD